MAIQNFLSGGYYGKLGATVGQRWKNKRTIRTYVVPANPRTPKQQENREKFAGAVEFSQMGLQMNYYTNSFASESMTGWNYRMKTSRELKKSGLNGLDLIPLYPLNFVPPFLITSFDIKNTSGQNHITFKCTNLNYASDRVLSLMFALYNEGGAFLGYKLYLGYYYAANPETVEVDVDDINEINTNCKVRCVTNDDVDSTTDMIASPTLNIGRAGPIVEEFDTAFADWEDDGEKIYITFEQPWYGTPNTFTITGQFYYYNETLGQLVMSQIQSFNYDVDENNGKVRLTIDWGGDIPLNWWSNGARLQIASIEYSGENFTVTATGKIVYFQ